MVKTIATVLFLLSGLVLISSIEPNSKLSLNEGNEQKDYQRLMKLQSLGVDFLEHFQNITLNDLDIPSTRIPSKDDLQCLSDMSLWMKGITSGSFWSLKMIDSWGTIPSGVLYLNLIDLGNYGECIKINREISSSHKLKGKYCLAELPVGKLLGINSAMTNIKIGVCFPSSCSATHMNTFFNTIIQKILGLNSKVNLVNPTSCKTNEREPFDGLTIFTIVLLSLFGCCALLATLYDYFLCQDQKQLPVLLKIFSIRATSRAFFRITMPGSNPNAIDCLHGMRCMSLIWVIFGHEYMAGLQLPNVNQSHIIRWLEEPFSQIVSHGVFAVDTFFFLSGLLVIMIALRSMDKSKGRLNVPLMYLHRYLRLTPLLAIAILVYLKLIPLLVDGPISYKGIDDYSKCDRTWYLTLLYVQNYATTDICLAHSWYLAVDMQMYIISPILLFALYKWGKKAAIGIVVLILLLTTYLFTIMMVKKYSLFSKNSDNNGGRILYSSTHMHATPWLIGAVFGYYLHVTRGKTFKLSRLAIWVGWLLTLAMIFTCLLALLPYAKWTGPELSTLSDSLYYSLTRIGWPIGLCWVVFACMQGYGGMANSFLSSPLWQPLSKLSYSAYVWHLLIQELTVRRVQSNTYFSNYEMMLRFWADFGFTILTAYFTYVTIEAPLGGLESMLVPNHKPAPKAEISADTKKTVEPVSNVIELAPEPELKADLEAVSGASPKE